MGAAAGGDAAGPGAGDTDDAADEALDATADAAAADDAWAARPIHQLPRYEVAWRAPTRGAAKALAKDVVAAFGWAPSTASKGKAPRVKAGKGRRHGGYGI